MASSRPGESNGGATGSIRPVFREEMKPMSDYGVSLLRDYDVSGIGAMLRSLSHCPFEVLMEALTKNLESFKKPNAIGLYPDKGKSKDEEDEGEEEDGEVVEDDDDYVDEDENDEDEDEEDKKGEEEILKLMGDDNKPATDGQLQVPNEGEPECKKPRLAEGFECQAEAAV